MEVKKIIEGMTAAEVSKLLDDNFNGLNTEKATVKAVEDVQHNVERSDDNTGVLSYPEFDSSKQVAVGDVRRHEGLLYRAVVAGAYDWDPGKWERVTLKQLEDEKLSELGSEVRNGIVVPSFKDGTMPASGKFNQWWGFARIDDLEEDSVLNSIDFGKPTKIAKTWRIRLSKKVRNEQGKITGLTVVSGSEFSFVQNKGIQVVALPNIFFGKDYVWELFFDEIVVGNELYYKSSTAIDPFIKFLDGVPSTGSMYNINVTLLYGSIPKENRNRIEKIEKEVVITGKNLFDKKKIIDGFVNSVDGVVMVNKTSFPNAKCSDRIAVEGGKYYSISGRTDTKGIVGYDSNGQRVQIVSGSWALPDYNGSFLIPDNVVEVQFSCILYAASIDSFRIQFEKGDVITEYEDYKNIPVNIELENVKNTLKELPEAANIKQKNSIKILSLGNSFAEDALSYVPFILKDSCPDIDLTLGILYYGGCSLEMHYNHFIEESEVYAYRKITPSDNVWITPNNKASIQQCVNDEDWDIIVFQQNGSAAGNYTTFQPYLNNLIIGLQSLVRKPVRFGWHMVEAYDSNLEASVTRFNSYCEATKKVLDETLIDIVFPSATGLQNARTTSLQVLGDAGNLMHTSSHAQEGIPCYCLALPNVLVILDLYGYGFNGIYGDKNIPTSSWITDRAIPNQNGVSVGATDENCRLAQISGVFAHKKPYEITDLKTLGYDR